jgi:diguanylate cyclase (GGDEF)-like protein
LHVVATKAEAYTGRQGSSWRASKKRRQMIRADQATVIADAMNPFCGIGCLLFAVVAATQFSFDQVPGSWASSTVAALTSVVLGVCFLVLRSARWGPVLRAHALPFGITVGALVILNPLVYVFGTQITYPAIGVLLVIVAVGGLLHDWIWAAVTILAIDIIWVGCAFVYGIPVSPATFMAQLLKANALAIVLNVARTRTVRRYEQARSEVHRLATTDELTGLANQRGLLEVARQLPGGGRHHVVELTVVYVDVDGLKSVNDAKGHAAGDALIRSVADVLRQAFRSQDTIARVGGDEFAVLLASTTPDVAGGLVARVHEQLAELGISASIGTASSARGSLRVDLAGLLERADAAMYAAKAARKNGSTWRAREG